MPHINDNWGTTESGCFGYTGNTTGPASEILKTPGDYGFPKKPCYPPNKPLAFDGPDAGCQAGTDLCQDTQGQATQELPNSFLSELTHLINRYCKENASNTPDYILAEYLCSCLDVFSTTVRSREQWYGRKTF
jgi:hypothetical protein